LVTALKRAKFDDIHGEELLAFTQVYQWVLNLAAIIQHETTKPVVPPAPKIEEIVAQAVPMAQTLPSPIQEPEKASKRVTYLKGRKSKKRLKSK
jgi:hypothetical protein